MFSGFVFTRYHKMTGMGTTVFERRVYYLQFTRGGACRTIQSHMGEHWVGQEAEGERGNVGTSLYCGFSQERKAGQGKYFRTG